MDRGGGPRLLGFLLSLLILGWTTLVAAQHHHAHPGPGGETKLDVHDDTAAHVLTVRVGPLNLPPRTEHVGSPVLFLVVPFDGWFVAYRPQVVDQNGATLPGRLLHHVELLNPARRNFICLQHEERIFAAGGELKDWPAVPGVGYRVAKGSPIRVAAMFHNPTDQPFPRAYLTLHIDYRLLGSAPLKNIYPAWFLVSHCGPSIYDLGPGTNVTTSEFTVPYSGRLLGVGGHIHDYGRQLRLENATRKEEIATLNTLLDAEGRLLSVPAVLFPERQGYRLDRGDTVKVTAVYDNPSGTVLRKAAMGIVIGYFLPDNEEDLAGMTREPRTLWRR